MVATSGSCADRAEAHRQAADYFAGIYGIDFARMQRYVVLGDAETVAERLVSYIRSGARGLTLIGSCHRPWTQLEPLALVRSLIHEELARSAPTEAQGPNQT